MHADRRLRIESEAQEALAVALHHVGSIQNQALPVVLRDGPDASLELIPTRELVLADAMPAAARLHKLVGEGALAATGKTHQHYQGRLGDLRLPGHGWCRCSGSCRLCRSRGSLLLLFDDGLLFELLVDLLELLQERPVVSAVLQAVEYRMFGVCRLLQEPQSSRESQVASCKVGPELRSLPEKIYCLLEFLLLSLRLLLAAVQRLSGLFRPALPFDHPFHRILRCAGAVSRAACPVQRRNCRLSPE
mmetsp:Transcript_94609/g.131468  ORF Transcript_94609/g.131468 Transcript_94609/m.131468 type:complete len:247 (-) Transcript_94609:639-1379(-)